MQSDKIHEDILRHLWSGQYLHTEDLATIDGRPLTVIEPGVLNRSTGPDFHDALIELDGTKFRGDIEFHRTIEDWKLHAHEGDAHYNSVILHVVLHSGPHPCSTTTFSGRAVPVLALDRFLSSPLEKIVEHVMRDEHLSRSAPLRCFSDNDKIDAAVIENFLGDLFVERMNEKEVRMFGRLCQIAADQKRGVCEGEEIYRMLADVDVAYEIPTAELELRRDDLKDPDAWEQLLYGALLDALGYSKNRLPFRMLSQLVPAHLLRMCGGARSLSVDEIHALLFAASGLLQPASALRDLQSKIYAHSLRSLWKGLTGAADGIPSPEPMHAAEWVFTPSRPSNFPTARIAAAGHLTARILYDELLERTISLILDTRFSAQEKLDQLLLVYDIPEDPFWSFHFSFSESSPKRHAVLGAMRKHDIIINVLLPLVRLHGRIYGDPGAEEHAAAVGRAVPLLESNAVVRKIERQLLKGRVRLAAAFQQQGAIQLYRRYCAVERCAECAVGKHIMKS